MSGCLYCGSKTGLVEFAVTADEHALGFVTSRVCAVCQREERSAWDQFAASALAAFTALFEKTDVTQPDERSRAAADIMLLHRRDAFRRHHDDA